MTRGIHKMSALAGFDLILKWLRPVDGVVRCEVGPRIQIGKRQFLASDLAEWLYSLIKLSNRPGSADQTRGF